jgi:ubiquinone/menaquinone biosynthesis C-methylase UbiE
MGVVFMKSKSVEERKYTIQRQYVSLEPFETNGLVLDIGGGGEGVIGQLLGERVIAIDPSKSELEEAASGPLKIIMDACDLKFLDNTFGAVTSFFTFMFIPHSDHKKVFEEIFRVMKSAGVFMLWDLTIPYYNNGEKDIYCMPITYNLNGVEHESGYGALWSNRMQDLEYFSCLGIEVGFEVVSRKINDQTFECMFKKP